MKILGRGNQPKGCATHHKSLHSTSHLLWYVLCHDGIEAVEEVGPGHAERDKWEEKLWPATVRAVAKVTGLAVKGDNFLHALGGLLSTTLIKLGELT